MASTEKKQIPALQRKRVIASSRAKVSTSKVRKVTKSILEESFIQYSPPSVDMASSWHSNPVNNTIPNMLIIPHDELSMAKGLQVS